MKNIKKILIVIVAVAFSSCDTAQTKMPATPVNNMPQHSVQQMSGVVMINGKMMSTINGKNMPMLHNTTMSNGTIVMPNGRVEIKSGETMMLKNGYGVMTDGKIKNMATDNGMMMENGMKN